MIGLTICVLSCEESVKTHSARKFLLFLRKKLVVQSSNMSEAKSRRSVQDEMNLALRRAEEGIGGERRSLQEGQVFVHKTQPPPDGLIFLHPQLIFEEVQRKVRIESRKKTALAYQVAGYYLEILNNTTCYVCKELDVPPRGTFDCGECHRRSCERSSLYTLQGQAIDEESRRNIRKFRCQITKEKQVAETRMQRVLELRRANEERRRGDEARAMSGAGPSANTGIAQKGTAAPPSSGPAMEVGPSTSTGITKKRTAAPPSPGPTTSTPLRAGPSSTKEPEDDSPLVAALRKNPMFSLVPDAQFRGERERSALFLKYLRSLRSPRARDWSKVKLTPNWKGNEFDRVVSPRSGVPAPAPSQPVGVTEFSNVQDRKMKKGDGKGKGKGSLVSRDQ